MEFDMDKHTPQIVKDDFDKHDVKGNIVDRIVHMVEKYGCPAYSGHANADEERKRSFEQQTVTYIGLARDYASHLNYLKSLPCSDL